MSCPKSQWKMRPRGSRANPVSRSIAVRRRSRNENVPAQIGSSKSSTTTIPSSSWRSTPSHAQRISPQTAMARRRIIYGLSPVVGGPPVVGVLGTSCELGRTHSQYLSRSNLSHIAVSWGSEHSLGSSHTVRSACIRRSRTCRHSSDYWGRLRRRIRTCTRMGTRSACCTWHP